MAVTQYVGARYVPKFYENSDNTSDWRSGVTYEPLTIVTYNGNSYTSKKPVPASVGNPSANLEYWAPTGIYNEQVETLRQEFEELKESTETAINEMMPKTGYEHVVLLSDSYGVNTATGGVSWIQHMKNNYASRINFYFAWGGAGFGYQPSETGYFPAYLGDLETDYEADAVIFLAGANDGNLVYLNRANEQNIYNGLQASVNILKNKYPNARIILGFVGRYKNPNHYQAYKRACEVYRNHADDLGYQYLTNSEYALHDTALIEGADIHPNSAGSEKLYYVARCALENTPYNEYIRYDFVNSYVEVHNEKTIYHYDSTADFTAITPDVTEVTPLRTVVPLSHFGSLNDKFKPVSIISGPASGAVNVGGSSVPATFVWYGSDSGLVTLTYTSINNNMSAATAVTLYLPKHITFETDTMLC
ncbi:MAG: SGNH/GDSL hydrolase family protein [Lachnospiraceae bacterium]|nr:SGNH/GDSL hydrolase family protein [Lachnospiraceae bacterium]